MDTDIIATETETMLRELGYASLDELARTAVPSAIYDEQALDDLPEPAPEAEVLKRLRALAEANRPGRAMIGQGYHGTITPAVIRRNVVENPAWYTAYTPYQPEISQGRLELLFAFQTMVGDLTGLPFAGASLLDEATAVAESVALARRAVKGGQSVVVADDLLPASLAVLRTRAEAMGWRVRAAEGALADAVARHEPFAVVAQVPGADGRLASGEELRAAADAAHAAGGLFIAACDPLALTLLQAPATWGADVAVGSTQRFGVPLYFGGPHAGYIAVRQGLERQLPGRLVGESVDAQGAPAFRLAWQTREQHIRRERATSNICTAQALLAQVAALYAIWHGPDGLTRIARGVHDKARRLAGALSKGGVLAHQSFFDTVPGKVPDAVAVAQRAFDDGVLVRLADAETVGVSVGEDATEDDLARVAAAFGQRIEEGEELGDLAGHSRDLPMLEHRVFNDYHDETKLMRYLRGLAGRDYALDTGMIPLGSCTMKLNPALAMEPISYPGFADLHPFAPEAACAGYRELIDQLCAWLAAVTGYDEVSVQPNAGSQGEFAGLLAIRDFHLANGQPQRDVCLIPASAHGTNAASAAMAGLRVVNVATAADGAIDAADLRAKLDQHGGELAVLMVTYPSTHGVFEEGLPQLCDLIHRAGGQVYVDGANLNAMMGLARPGRFGADVSHLNLHKTFAIPHGGGGPGVGPVAVRRHLAPYLPKTSDEAGRVSAAPFGSPGVLPISYAYIASVGGAGLRQASQTAILKANYVAKRLSRCYPILYTGHAGLVAHECIVDLRPVLKASGITIDDVAKRLIDYGFHAPTMSFPVPNTLMVEPTESEPLAELDRFCAAMEAIKAEADAVAEGRWPAEDNPLRNAPHPASAVLADEWNHPYSRRTAAFPTGFQSGPLAEGGRDKYWPPVARIDGPAGDRHLVARWA
ncbi:MAG: aminomethyl-transferring glycine dehydrogenase [Propionibacteriaceae bacterium]|jgi:glycine dehydrogenase|nr:aminomethyl-transferring glycine dehydrogenase [Propionibacteriaceae bacterium]